MINVDGIEVTSESFCTGVDPCQTLGRPEVGDFQDAAVGVDQDVVPLTEEQT